MKSPPVNRRAFCLKIMQENNGCEAVALVAVSQRTDW
jgi:hypothetical protein